MKICIILTTTINYEWKIITEEASSGALAEKTDYEEGFTAIKYV